MGKEPLYKAVLMHHNIGESPDPKGMDLVSIGTVGRALGLLAEVLVFEGVRVGDVGAFTRLEVEELVRGVRVATHE